MAKTIDKRFRCSGCRAPLGRRDGPTLAVQGPRILATPAGVTVTCPACRAEKTWRPLITRRATIHLGAA